MAVPEKAAGKPPRGGEATRSRHPPESKTHTSSPSKVSPGLWRAISRGLGDRAGTIPLVLALLVALSLFSAWFSEVHVGGEYSDYLQRAFSSLVTPPKVYPGLVKRHGVRFPRLLHAHGEEGFRENGERGLSEVTKALGVQSKVIESGVAGVSASINGAIGIVQIAQGAFLAAANNSSLVNDVSTSGQNSVNNLVLNLTNPSLVNPTDVEPINPVVLLNQVNSSLVSPDGLGLVTVNLSSAVNISQRSPQTVVLNTTAGNLSSKNVMPTPEFWPAAFYKPGTAAYDKRCDLGDGEWVLGTQRKNISNCPFASQKNERCAWRFAREPNYREYRWQPRGCALPEFDAR